MPGIIQGICAGLEFLEVVPGILEEVSGGIGKSLHGSGGPSRVSRDP